MLPQIELYLNADCAWVTEPMLEEYSAALQALLPELLATPQGPDHVLTGLDVVEISIVDDATIAWGIFE